MKRRAVSLLFMLIAATFVAADPVRDDGEKDQLRRRVAELEAQLARLQQARGYTPDELSTEKNVKPGINDSWRSEEIGPLIGRLETESREIFTHRFDLAAVVGAPEGAVVADIGAGSGFMTNIFARQVGPAGKVYAVDINPALMRHVAEGAKVEGLENVETVVCNEKSVELPEESIDIAFVCDTYHHFEYPKNSMSSIHKALRPGGQLVLVEFHRIPGKTDDWLLGHVRAGEDVFAREIVEAGFELVNDHDVDFLDENYVLRFRKVD